jgi:hypothetical protein
MFENVTVTFGSKEKSIVANVLSGLVINPCIEETISLKIWYPKLDLEK